MFKMVEEKITYKKFLTKKQITEDHIHLLNCIGSEYAYNNRRLIAKQLSEIVDILRELK